MPISLSLLLAAGKCVLCVPAREWFFLDCTRQSRSSSAPPDPLLNSSMKASLLAAFCLLCISRGQQARAQTAFASASASASVTILPSDPTLRPVPPSGFGVSYTSAAHRSARAAMPHWSDDAQPERSNAPLTSARDVHRQAAVTEGASSEGLQIRNPVGERYASHIVRAVLRRGIGSPQSSTRAKQIIVVLE